MQLYMAPLEGITGFVFRNAYQKYYGGVDRYFTPFITPHTKKNMDQRERRDILPENNDGIPLVPQVLTNQVEELLSISSELREMGYKEINLNLGCPSGTVAAKKKGSGFLSEPEKLDHFLEEYFEKGDVKLSLKTRIGVEALEEWEEILAIYEKYPLSELIIHPRLGKEFYKGVPHYDAFSKGLERCSFPVCYNGDLMELEDYQKVSGRFADCQRYMIGRGLVYWPALMGEIKKGEPISWKPEQFLAFHDAIVAGYETYLSGDRTVLFRMKELWGYWQTLFPEEKKLLKGIKKSDTLREYRTLVRQIIRA